MDESLTAWLKILEPTGINFAEFAVMREIEKQALVRQVAAVDAYENSYGARGPHGHCEDYLRAIDVCAERGWLHVVDFHDEEKEKTRLLRETIPACDDNSVPRAGDLDFTPAGYERYRIARALVFGNAVTGLRYDPHQLRLEIYSDDLQVCEKKREELLRQPNEEFPVLRDDIEKMWDYVIRKTEYVEPPIHVGPWRLNRHEVIPSGFRISIQYRLEPLPVQNRRN